MFEDWPLLEASFAQQYGIRLEQENEMSWNEFFNLMCGLLPESPLGQIVSIRAEKDPERLKGFNKDQKAIRTEWRKNVDQKRIKNMTKKEKEEATQEIQNMFKQMFKKEG